MFVLSMISPTGFPVAMAVCGSMEQAMESAKQSSDPGQWNKWSIEKESECYAEGFIMVNGMCHKWSIVECELSLQARSVFRDENE